MGLVSSCRGCLGSVLVVEDLRDQVRDLGVRLTADIAIPAIAPSAQLPSEEGDISRKSWNRALRAAAEEASHQSYDPTGEGFNLRIANAILELRR